VCCWGRLGPDGVFFYADFFHEWTNSYGTFYYAAKAMQAGGDIYASHAPGLKPNYVYPPLFAFLSLISLSVDLSVATRVWLAVDVLITWLALGLGAWEMIRRFQLPSGWPMGLLLASGAFLLSVGEVKTEWSTGQTDTLILLAFVLALRWLDRAPVFAGLALGFSANIKYQTLLALPWMIARRRWRAAGVTVLATLGFASLPAVVSGWAGNLWTLKVAFAGLVAFVGVHSEAAAKTMNLTWIRSVSVTSAIGRLLELLHANPARAFALSGLVAVLFLGIMWCIYRARSLDLFSPLPAARALAPPQPGITALEWVGLMVAWLVFGPEVSRRHMFVLLLLHLTVLGVLASPVVGFSRKPLVIGLIIWQIGLRLPPSHPAFFQSASDFWIGVGGPSWCLLFVYTTLLWSGLDWARHVRAAPPLDNADRLQPRSSSA
jgi:glycosyl transferase family 87